MANAAAETLFEPTADDVYKLLEQRHLHLEDCEFECEPPAHLEKQLGQVITVGIRQLSNSVTRICVTGEAFPHEGLRNARWHDVYHHTAEHPADFRSQWAHSLGGAPIPEPVELARDKDPKDMRDLYAVLEKAPDRSEHYSLPEAKDWPQGK